MFTAVLTAEEQGLVNLFQMLTSLLPWLFLVILETVPCSGNHGESFNDVTAVDGKWISDALTHKALVSAIKKQFLLVVMK